MPDTETPAIQALLAKGRECGKVTVADLMEAFPVSMTSPDRVETFLAILSENNIQVVEK